MPKYFVDKENINKNYVNIINEDYNHIVNVFRKKIGDHILVNDMSGYDYECEIIDIKENIVEAKILNKKNNDSESKTKIKIYQSLPKGSKMESIIQKTVELGIDEIIPVYSKNCVVKLEDKKAVKKVERWNKIALAAAKQCGRGKIPVVRDIISFKEAIDEAKNDDLRFVLYENEKDLTIRNIFDISISCENISFFVGPEGGYTENEIIEAKKNNIQSISLGNRILRTETVGIVVLSIIMYNMEEI